MLLIFVSAGLSVPCLAQVKKTIKGVKASSGLTLDGELTKPFWTSAPIADTFTDYVTGEVVKDQTRVRILYDATYIYLGFECLDGNPELVTARETVRDSKFQNSNGPTNNEDNVEVDLDPFLTHSYGDISRFSVNAIGTRSAAIAGGRGSKAEWKGDWDAAVKITKTGWTCEMRIPWASFHYPPHTEPTNLGINFTRYINRTRVIQEWSRTGPQGFLENEGIWTGVELPHAGFKRHLSLLPYVLGGYTGSTLGGKIGIDGRYTLTPQLTAVGTINPDYSNIEGSVQSIAYSHQVHSVAETRPFFLEGGNDFSDQTNINDIGAFFYSPAIQKFDAGAKLYGKITPLDTIGALDTVSFGGRNDLVARYTHSFDATTSAGLMTVGSSDSAASSIVNAFDAHTRLGKLQMETVVSNSEGPGAGGGAENFSVNYQDKKLTSCIQYSGISNNFVAPDGYFPFTGYKGFVGVEDYANNWRTGYFRSAELTLVPIWWNQMDGSSYYRGLMTSYNMTTKNDLYLEADYNRLDFLGVPDNYYNFQIIQGLTNRFRQFGLQFLTGIQGGEPSTLFGPSVSLRLLKKLDLGYQGLIQNRLGQIQQHIITANYELSPTKSFGGRAVFQNSDTNVYLFFHNSGGKGTDFFLLFGDPNATKTVTSLQAKVIFSF